MRKFYYKYVALTAMAAAALSCSIQEENLTKPGSLSLEFQCAEIQTRADDPETAIESIDYFIYTSPSGSAVYHQRITSTSATAVFDDVEALAQDGLTCYIYAVANIPSSISLTGSETIAELQAITVETDFTGAQTSFVMDSKEYVTTAVGSSATVPLHRLAAKLTMTVNIPESITNESVTYVPDYSHLRIYYVSATKKGSFDGSHMTYGTDDGEEANAAYYFNYPADWIVTTSGSGPYVGTTATPFYTYPQAWATEELHEPYFKVILPWAVVGDTGSSRPYYYKVVIPNDFNGKIDRNTFYKFVMDIGVLGSEVDDGSVEIIGEYYVVDWNSAFKVAGDNALTKGKYLNVAQTEYSIYAENSITIPVTSSHNLTIDSRSATYINYNSDNPASVPLNTGNYSVTATGRNSITLTHNLISDLDNENLDCSIYTFTITIGNAADCAPVTVKVTQYPSLYISNEVSNRFVAINGYVRNTNNRNYSISDDGGPRPVPYLLKFQDNISTYNNNGLRVVIANTRDYTSGFFNTFRGKQFGTSANAPGTMTITAPEGETITGLTISYYNGMDNVPVTYSPAGTSSSQSSWSGSASTLTVTMPYGGSNNSSNVVESISVSYTGGISNTAERLGGVRGQNYSLNGNNNFNIYTINVSNLSGNDYDWYIADPRMTEPVTIECLKGGSATGQPLTGYLWVEPSSAMAIAPQFKIASSSGASVGGNYNDYQLTYDQAMRRCASYQEDGYPAGRWRVPTTAEIQFVIKLSTLGKIPSLFNYHYWSAGAVIVNEQGNVASGTTASIRCVYDSWYWGDEPVEQYRTTWSGWQTGTN